MVLTDLSERAGVTCENAHPVFNYLKSELKGVLGTGRVKWNFTKFLVDKDGKPLKRFSPTTKPEKIEKYLETIL